MSIQRIFKLWSVALIIVVSAIYVSFQFLDIPIARFFYSLNLHVAPLAHLLNSPVLIAFELAALICLAILYILRGRLTDGTTAFFFALCASILALEANDRCLKVIFGRPTPGAAFAQHVGFGFRFFEGNQLSGFPSGHIAMATAFAVTFARFRCDTWPFFIVTLAILTILLLAGEWHFLSDLIAGLFLGGTIGLIAGEIFARLWQKDPPGRNNQ